MPSSTSTVWVRIGGTASGRPARAAMPTAIIAPEISPPGRFAHKNSSPPALPIASVSSALRILSRLGIADAIDAGIRVTPPYGKSAPWGQMQPCDAAMRAITSPQKGEVIQSQQCRGKKTSDYFAAAPGLSPAALRHSERNFLRSLPCRPLASASLEHSSEAAVCGFSAFGALASALGAASLAAGAAAGAVVCADAEPISRSEATAAAVAREEIFIMGHLK